MIEQKLEDEVIEEDLKKHRVFIELLWFEERQLFGECRKATAKFPGGYRLTQVFGD